MNNLLDVLHAMIDGLLRAGGIGEKTARDAHDVIDAHNDVLQPRPPAPPAPSPASVTISGGSETYPGQVF